MHGEMIGVLRQRKGALEEREAALNSRQSMLEQQEREVQEIGKGLERDSIERQKLRKSVNTIHTNTRGLSESLTIVQGDIDTITSKQEEDWDAANKHELRVNKALDNLQKSQSTADQKSRKMLDDFHELQMRVELLDMRTEDLGTKVADMDKLIRHFASSSGARTVDILGAVKDLAWR